MRYTPIVLVDVEKFWRDGYVIVKRVFTTTEIESFRRSAYQRWKRIAPRAASSRMAASRIRTATC